MICEYCWYKAELLAHSDTTKSKFDHYLELIKNDCNENPKRQMTPEQFADQLKTRLKLYQFEMEERGLPAQTIHIEGVLRIIDRTLAFKDIMAFKDVDQIEDQNYQALSADEFVGRLKKALKP